jgi:hypothetical protein
MRVKVGSLQTFELLLPKLQNSKNLALKIKTTKGKSIDLSDDESEYDEEMAMIARKLKKFFRKNRNFRSKESKISGNPSDEVRNNHGSRDDENQRDKFSHSRKCRGVNEPSRARA